MKRNVLILLMIFCSFPLIAAEDKSEMQRELQQLQQQTQQLQAQLDRVQKQLVKQAAQQTRKVTPAENKKTVSKRKIKKHRSTALKKRAKHAERDSHSSVVYVNNLNHDPESLLFYPTILMADGHALTYIAGTPVVTAPYLGSRPAFDGSDYIVNISSINRDIRLMQQRRRLYQALDKIGTPKPPSPIIALSGKVEPVAEIGSVFSGTSTPDFTVGSSELDTAAILNDKVEGYLSLGFDEAPIRVSGQRIGNARVGFNMGFVNIGDLDETPLYFTAGQLYVPFGRFSTSMVSAPLTMLVGRTKSRPFILGYKSQTETGLFAAIYAFKSDTTLGNSATGGANLGYVFEVGKFNGEFGGSVISSINDAGGMQYNGTPLGPTFGGFASFTNGNENVRKIPAVDAHATLRFDRYNLTAEWVGVTNRFRTEDLSFNGRGAIPQALQLEAGVTFIAFTKPSSLAFGYQRTQDALALNLPQQRFAGVFNISIWRDTVESLEYRHDIGYGANQYANGAAPAGSTNANTIGGHSEDTLLAQIGVYF